MIKKFAKVLMIVLAVVMVLTTVACKGCNEDAGSTDVTLKNPGDVVQATNGGAVVETANYFYYINGIGATNADNSYGTPKKGSIMVYDKASNATEVVVPKIVSSEDYTAGIYVFGDYVYYGTTTTKKDTDGNIAYGTMEFQKAKLDGSSVEEVLRLGSHDVDFRFTEVNGTVYLVYAEVEDSETSIICLNTSNGNSSTVVEKVSSYTFVENADLSKATVVYTKSVVDEDSEQDKGYNELYAYKAGSNPTLVLTGDKGETNFAKDVTYTITAVKSGYIFVSQTAIGSTAKNLAIDLANLSAKPVELTKNTDKIATAYIVSLDEIYFPYSTSGNYIMKGSLTGAEDVIVSNDIAVTIIGVEVRGGDKYIIYIDDQSFLCAVKADESNPQDTLVLLDKGVNTSWYTDYIQGGYLFFADASDLGKDYLKTIKISAIDFSADFEEDEDLKADLLKEEKIISLANYEDADKAGIFDAMVVAYQSVAYDSNQRVKVRDDKNELIKDSTGRVYNEQFDKVVAFYNTLTDDQKDMVDQTALDGYNLYVECFKVNNILRDLEGFNEANKAGNANDYLAKVNAAKTAMDAYISSHDNFESVFNMVDNNLLWEYYGGTDVQGALAWLNAQNA